MKKLILWLLLGVTLLGVLGSAAFFLLQNGEEEGGYKLYYLNQEEDKLMYEAGMAEESDSNALIAELYLLQQTLPEKNKDGLKLLLPEDVTLQNFSLDNELLTLNFSSGYTQMSVEREILVRAGMVRLFTQIQGVKRVQFQIDGEPLTNAEGQEIGSMTESRFVENSGKEINSYQKTTLTLYFADKDGGKLVPEERSVYYNSNVPLEKVVVEQLVKGPKDPEHMATLPSELNILSVTTQDQICYVNLDGSFATHFELATNVLDPELAVYSIVTSLADDCQVDKIQISVNGKTSVTVGTVDLGGLFSVREDLLKVEEEDGEETGETVEAAEAAETTE